MKRIWGNIMALIAGKGLLGGGAGMTDQVAESNIFIAHPSNPGAKKMVVRRGQRIPKWVAEELAKPKAAPKKEKPAKSSKSKKAAPKTKAQKPKEDKAGG